MHQLLILLSFYKRVKVVHVIIRSNGSLHIIATIEVNTHSRANPQTHTPKQWDDKAREITSIGKAELQPALIPINTVESEGSLEFDRP